MKNNNLKKSVLAVLILGFILFCVSVNIFATSNAATIEPRWTSIYNIDLGISFSNGDGNVSGTAIKHATDNLIEGTLYLYKLVDDEWVYMDEWYKSKAIGTLGISGDFSCESGVTYKGVFTVTAYTDGIPETETVEFIKTCP